MEQVLDWLNENERRMYPLQEGAAVAQSGQQAYTLPENFLLDLQLKVPFSLSEDVTIYLKTLKYTAGGVEVSFGSSSQSLILFNIPLVSAYPVYIRTETGQLGVFGEGVADFINWSIEEGTQDTVLTAMLPVEAATCIQYDNEWLGVNSISATPSKQTEDILNSFAPLLPLVSVVSPAKLEGDVTFLGGYNFRVAIADNLLDLEISDSYGLRMSCSTSFISSEYLDCGDLVSYINGIPPDSSGNFRLNAGSNINIISGNTIDVAVDPDINLARQHSLFVGLSFQATDLCAPINLAPITT